MLLRASMRCAENSTSLPSGVKLSGNSEAEFVVRRREGPPSEATR